MAVYYKRCDEHESPKYDEGGLLRGHAPCHGTGFVPLPSTALGIEDGDDETVRLLCRHIRAGLAKCSVPPIEVPPMDLEAAVRSALRAAVGDQEGR